MINDQLRRTIAPGSQAQELCYESCSSTSSAPDDDVAAAFGGRGGSGRWSPFTAGSTAAMPSSPFLASPDGNSSSCGGSAVALTPELRPAEAPVALEDWSPTSGDILAPSATVEAAAAQAAETAVLISPPAVGQARQPASSALTARQLLLAMDADGAAPAASEDAALAGAALAMAAEALPFGSTAIPLCPVGDEPRMRAQLSRCRAQLQAAQVQLQLATSQLGATSERLECCEREHATLTHKVAELETVQRALGVTEGSTEEADGHGVLGGAVAGARAARVIPSLDALRGAVGRLADERIEALETALSTKDAQLHELQALAWGAYADDSAVAAEVQRLHI